MTGHALVPRESASGRASVPTCSRGTHQRSFGFFGITPASGPLRMGPDAPGYRG